MTKRLLWFVLALPLIGSHGLARDNDHENRLTIALDYRQPDLDDEDDRPLRSLRGLGIEVRTPSDDRDELERIGVNIEEDRPIAIYTSTPVSEFVEEALITTLKELRLVPERDAGLTIVVSVRELYVVESHLYHGSVRLKISLLAGERQLWSGLVRGSDTRWGRSLNADNYVEALSESAREAFMDAFSDPEFEDVLWHYRDRRERRADPDSRRER